MDELLRYYFQKGFSYKNILLFLSKYHDTEMSMRSLQQRLHGMGLKRRNISYNIQEIRQEIVTNLNGLGCSGYRSHWHALRLKGIQVPRRVVEELCLELDPFGCHERKAHRLFKINKKRAKEFCGLLHNTAHQYQISNIFL